MNPPKVASHSRMILFFIIGITLLIWGLIGISKSNFISLSWKDLYPWLIAGLGFGTLRKAYQMYKGQDLYMEMPQMCG